MHGLARPLLLYAKPWQRIFLGFGLIALGLTTGAFVLPVFGGVLVVGTACEGFRLWQTRRARVGDGLAANGEGPSSDCPERIRFGVATEVPDWREIPND